MVRCSAYDDTTPILSIDTVGASVSVTPTGNDATDDALRFARELASKAQEFAAEVERIHAAQPGSGGTKGCRAATDKAAKSKAA
jgi:hypothetical protein